MISDFLTRQRFHRLGLYAEFFRAVPVEHQIAISLPGPEQQVIGVAMNRGVTTSPTTIAPCSACSGSR